MNQVKKLVNQQNVKGLVNFLCVHGISLNKQELQDLKVNVVEKAVNDNFSQEVYQSDLPNLVDALTELAEIRERNEKHDRKMKCAKLIGYIEASVLMEDIPELIKTFQTQGEMLSQDYLKKFRLNVLQRARFDDFFQKIHQTELPRLVDSLIKQ